MIKFMDERKKDIIKISDEIYGKIEKISKSKTSKIDGKLFNIYKDLLTYTNKIIL